MAGSVYHAWINVYSEEEGWIDAAIYFDGQEWKLMDPTFASSNNSSQAIMKYIGNGANYQAKYEEGWIDAAIYFDGQEWKLMDPTFASSNNSSQAIMKYIGNGANYQAKYLY